MEVLNLLAIILVPIVSVWVGQFLQDRSEKRKDKMRIFQCLMSRRAVPWGYDFEVINALNSIDIVFSDDENVRKCWATLLSEFDVNLDDLEKEAQLLALDKQKKARWELLKSMSENLGYKGKITENNIQKPYYPIGLNQQIIGNIQCQDAMRRATEFFAQLSNTSSPTKATQEDTAHANP